MKKTSPTLLVLLTALAALPTAGLFAQAPAAPAVAATPSVSVPAGTATTATAGNENEAKMRMKAMATLTPEEKQKLRAAHQAALQDPAVKAAEANRATPQGKRAYRQAQRAAMLKADPSIGPILDKIKEANPGRKALVN